MVKIITLTIENIVSELLFDFVIINIGCKDALEIIPEYVDTKQDRYMEFLL